MRLLVVLMLVLAGCAAPEPMVTEDVPEEIQDVEVTDKLGAIRGVVVDETITPLAGATVVLKLGDGGRNATTSEKGAFSFQDLEPSTYFLTVQAVGYEKTQSSVTVEAGVTPPVTRIMLTSDPESIPRVSMETWDAFLQCGVGAPNGVGSWNPCLFTGSDNVHYFPNEGGPTAMQAEAHWTGSQPLGNRLWFQFGALRGNGDSPMAWQLTGEPLDDSTNSNGEIMSRVFAGDDEVTVILEQKYEIYVQSFYNFVPVEGYMFVVDGPCNPSTACA